jgi:hypothetical protein
VRNHPVIPVGRRWAFAVASAGGAIALAAAMAPATSAVAATQAASSTHISGSATYHGHVAHVTRLGGSVHGLKGLHAVTPHAAAGHPRVVPFRSPNGPAPAGKNGLQAPSVSSSALVTHAVAKSTVSLIHAFNGLSDADQAGVNGGSGVGEVTPPDQGLCVGFDHTLPGNPKVVIELVNDAFVETSPSGTVLRGPVNLATLFGDPGASGDIRCSWDQKTASFFFTEIGVLQSGGDAGNFATDLTVLNGHGLVQYQVDTSEGATCFPDQPKTGFDNNAVVISTDEYCGAGENTEEGALVVAISKPQLVAGTTPNAVFLGNVSLAGIPIVGLDPAINTGTGTSYFVNSFAFTAAGNNNTESTALGYWTLTGDHALISGTGTIVLTGKVIKSERYSFPVLATSTGDGSVTASITSEALVNPDDSRLSGPVTVTKADDGAVQLWTALDTAVSVGTSPAAVDGAAWFKINTATKSVASQGYVAQKGANLLYPAIQAPASGPAAVVFTITSPTINPSAAYTSLGSGKITIVGHGAGAHLSFCESLPGGICPFGRWGDYSWATTDPGTNGIWLATEYIPPTSSQDPFDNWGTYVFKLSN